jgi:RNA polymerase sigma-B factor
MMQSALLRDWEWLQDQVIPPLLARAGDRPTKLWSVGSVADAVAVSAALAERAGPGSGSARAYVTGCGSSAAVSFAAADLGSVPAASRAAWFRPEQRRWVPQPVIADQVVLGEPAGLVDLVTLPGVADLWSGPGGTPAQDRLRRGGHLLLVEPAAVTPGQLRPLDEGGRLFERVTAPPDHGQQTVPAGGGTADPDRADPDWVDPDWVDPDWVDAVARRQYHEDLVNRHINLARALARRFAHRGEPVDDLQQVAFLALVKAARRFDPAHQAAFSTYATVSILGELKRHFRDKTWMLRVPRSAQELYLSIKDAREQLGHQLGRSPTLADIAAHLGVDHDDVMAAVQAGGSYWPASLDAPGPDGERSIDVAVVDAGLDGAVDRQQLRALLPRLDQRERLILKRIYFDGATQQQVAKEIGASQMQVSRLLSRTLDKLRQWSNHDTTTTSESPHTPHPDTTAARSPAA